MTKPLLTAAFGKSSELLAQRTHLAMGAVVIPLPDPPPEPFAEVLLRVVGVNGATADLEGRVLQIFEGRGMAVAFDDRKGAEAKLAPLFDAAAAAQADGEPARVVWGEPEAAPAAAAAPDEESLQRQIATMTSPQKIQLALKGDRTARLLLLKDVNKTLHSFLLQNPRITLDEVRFMASYKQTAPEALETIAGNSDYTRHQAIVTALVRNPKTPAPVAARLVEKLPEAEVRRLAKSNDVPRPVQAAARKRINE